MSKENKTYQNAMDTAVRLLARRNHTAYEIRQKLGQRGVGKEITEKVIAECKRLNYINEASLARFYIQELMAKGYGVRKIRFSMKKKGISDALAEEMISLYSSEADELANARRSLEKKYRAFLREKDMRKRREKIYRFLYARGFSNPVISALLSYERQSG